MGKLKLDALKKKELAPGFVAQMIHSDDVTIAFWEINEGSELPMHSHEHEQFSVIQEGEFEFVIEGEKTKAGEGDVIYFARNQEHGGMALTACKILDVFAPARETYRGA